MKEALSTIYIVRHGETNHNRGRKVQGHLQIPLNEYGRAQAKKASERFSDIRFDAVYSSDLIRAKETAEILTRGRKLEIELSNKLRERFLGNWQGQSSEHPSEDLQKAINDFLALSPDDRWNSSIVPGSETNAELVGRAFTFLRAVALKHLSKTVLLVTHGGVMRVLLIHLGVLDRAKAYDYRLANLASIQLQSDGVSFIVKAIEGLTRKK